MGKTKSAPTACPLLKSSYKILGDASLYSTGLQILAHKYFHFGSLEKLCVVTPFKDMRTVRAVRTQCVASPEIWGQLLTRRDQATTEQQIPNHTLGYGHNNHSPRQIPSSRVARCMHRSSFVQSLRLLAPTHMHPPSSATLPSSQPGTSCVMIYIIYYLNKQRTFVKLIARNRLRHDLASQSICAQTTR